MQQIPFCEFLNLALYSYVTSWLERSPHRKPSKHRQKMQTCTFRVEVEPVFPVIENSTRIRPREHCDKVFKSLQEVSV